MWTKRCALYLRGCRLALSPDIRSSVSTLLLCLVLLFACLSAAVAWADDIIILAVEVNLEKQGEFFVVLRDDGDFLVRAEDLREMGFTELPAERVSYEGETYVSLRSLPDVSFNFNQESLTLGISATPELLTKSTLDLSYARQGNVYYPRETSFFLNYGVDSTFTGDSSPDFQVLTVSNEVGLRFKEILLLSDSIYTETPDHKELVRLNSSLVWDQQDQLRRVTAGDLVATSSALGSRLQLGGVGLSKIYRIDPYFINYPLFDFSGLLPLPAEVDIFVDGTKIRSEHFPAGEFELLNFQGIRGAQDVEIIIRDVLGREQRISNPVYATDQVLSRGLHEYSYNLGFLRRDFGVKSNRYDDNPVFSAFHRYGLSDRVNIGGRAELGDSLTNFGANTSIVLGHFGLMQAEAATSISSGNTGFAGQLTYRYQTRNFNLTTGLQSYSKQYRTINDLGSMVDRKQSLHASIGYLTRSFGSFGLRLLDVDRLNQQDRREVTVSWSRHLLKNAYLSASLSFVDEDTSYTQGLVNLNWHFGKNRSMTVSHLQDEVENSQTIELRQTTPAGQGTGWSIQAKRAESGNDQLDSFVQHNAKKAILRADFNQDRSGSGMTTTTRLALSGALVYVGSTLDLTRPVRDSFSLISVGEAENVRVYINGQTGGRTGEDGQVIIPDLFSYYENQVSIESKDIPLDYLMPQVRLNVSPPFRSGTCINFPLQRYQAFTGTILVAEQGTQSPLANVQLTLHAPTGDIPFWTSRDGEFYLDSQSNEFDILAAQGCEESDRRSSSFLPSGVYTVTARYAGRAVQGEIVIPQSDETFTELGTLTVQ